MGTRLIQKHTRRLPPLWKHVGKEKDTNRVSLGGGGAFGHPQPWFAHPCKSYLCKTLITLQTSPSQLINSHAPPEILQTLICPASYKILKETLMKTTLYLLLIYATNAGSSSCLHLFHHVSVVGSLLVCFHLGLVPILFIGSSLHLKIFHRNFFYPW